MNAFAEGQEDQLISLTAAAEALQVHYMTAYRYVRTGRMPAVKHGGQWWVERSDLDAVAEAGTGRRPTVEGEPRELLVEPFLQRLLAGDSAGCGDVITSALQAGAAPTEVHHRLLQPALHEVGLRWASGKITIAAEHRATATATSLIGQISPLFRHPGRNRGAVVVGSVAGDPHGLPSAMLTNLLVDRRFEVVDLGANTPAESFIEAAQEIDGLVAIGICVVLDTCVDTAARSLVAIRDELPGTALIVGGAGVANQRELFEPLADHVTLSSTEACAAFELALAGRKDVAASESTVERA